MHYNIKAEHSLQSMCIETKKELEMVKFTNTTANPRAMVIKFHNTLSATFAMLHSIPFQALTYVTEIIFLLTLLIEIEISFG